MSDCRSNNIVVNDRVVSYLSTSKKGEVPLLLLHGGGFDRASLSWRFLIPHLALTHEIVAPDFPGYGESTAFGQPHTVADLGKWLLAFLDRLDIPLIDVVGVSMGGGVALWIALHHPDRIRRLVPVDTYGIQEQAPYHRLSHLLVHLPLNTWSYAVLWHSRWAMRRALSSIYADPNRIDDALLDEVQSVLAVGASKKTFADFQRGEVKATQLHTRLMSKLPTLRNPVLFVHGRHDTLVPLSNVRTAVSKIPNARLELLDAGHWPMREMPDEFNEIVSTFLK